MECDIVIPVWNQPAITKECIESVLRHTEGVDYGLIIIDNGSDDETRRYLDSLKTIKVVPITVIRKDKNAGFIKAVNQGIRMSKAASLCIMNNDTLATAEWLKEMLAVLHKDNDIGIVNPSSNNLGQKPQEGEPMEIYAEKLKKECGRFVELGAAIGFCMLIKREVIEKIGLLDEIYGMGNFEDTDFSRRAIKEGYRCVRACGAYVYHRENTSFNRLKTYDDDFKRNRQIYEFRWGKPKRLAYILDAHDENALCRLNQEFLRTARSGNWVWCFTKRHIELPQHSNIICRDIPGKRFYLKTVFSILKKKKKFDSIFVREESLGRILELLAFLHRARIEYY